MTFCRAMIPCRLSEFFIHSPFFSVSGGAGSPNDLDIFVYDSTGTNILAGAVAANEDGDPVEIANRRRLGACHAATSVTTVSS